MMRHTCTEVSQVSGLANCAGDILDTCVESMNAILLFDLLHTQAVIPGILHFSTYSRCWARSGTSRGEFETRELSHGCLVYESGSRV
jgi:hypothetical protein